jgi:hypothetical protein
VVASFFTYLLLVNGGGHRMITLVAQPVGNHTSRNSRMSIGIHGAVSPRDKG